MSVTSARTSAGAPDIPDIPIRNFGYLYLADNEDFADIPRRDQALQAACGAGTRMLTGEQIASAYPFYHLDDIVAGSLNTVDEGDFDALTMVDRRAARPSTTVSTTSTTRSSP